MPDQASIHAVLKQAGAEAATLAPPIGGAVSPIHRAVENRCRLAHLPDGSAMFVKELEPDMRTFVDPARVVEASRKAGEAGISPRLLAADVKAGVLVFEALGDGWTWGWQDRLQDPDTLAALFAAKRRFHDGAPLHETRTVFALIEEYLAMATTAGAPLPATVGPALEAARRAGAALAAAGTDSVSCHADGAASNMMLGPDGGLQLIDFEWARQTDPAHDIGTVLAELFPDDGAAHLAIEIATGRTSSQALARARLFGAADDLMWALWGFVLAYLSPRKQIEFAKYAEWRLLRARVVLEGPRFGPWLEQV